ncbi:MAG: hypothetical protein N2053_00665 [Chitinispirillaceae bacterium]|nr:hypothetical protein [Chitinispirillaceae bacterium]
MTDKQWEILKKVINGEKVVPNQVGFIIDSPWLPNWYGITILDYFTSEELWFKANFKVVKEFGDVIFLPGFWSEFGMCTEPSAFGVRCVFPENEFPFANKIINNSDEIESLPIPEPATDGLLPLVLNRLRLNKSKIENCGHKIRFAVARGPLNIASYLMGTTELITTMMMEPEKIHNLLNKITSFLKKWITLQRETFPTIDGIFLLDDIIGFLGEEEFCNFALPYFKELFDKEVSVRFLHNDAQCKVSAPYLAEMNVNLFNMGFDVTLKELHHLTKGMVAFVGNLPPRDVLATNDSLLIKQKTVELMKSLSGEEKVIFSCGGGMPPGVTSESIKVFLEAIKKGE